MTCRYSKPHIRLRTPNLAGTRMIVLGMLWLLASSLPLAGEPVTKKFPKGAFDGKWNGEYEENGKAKKAGGVYELTEHEDGSVTGKAIWGEKGQFSMPLNGKRFGEKILSLKGVYTSEETGAKITYRYIGEARGDALVLPYLAFDAQGKQIGYGYSRLTRPTKPKQTP